MKKFIVVVREVYEQNVTVKADSREDARRIVEDGIAKGDENETNYAYTLDSDEWDVIEE